MANFCEYRIRAIGTEENLYNFLNSLPVMEYREVVEDGYVDDKIYVVAEGNCKWSINYGCKEFDEDEIDFENNGAEEYTYMTMRQKSEVLGIEIQAHYWSEESEFDQFDHYINGELVKQRKIAYDEDNEFNWDTLEFEGYEGVYDESVDGEESDMDFMNMLLGALGGGQTYEEEDDGEEDLMNLMNSLSQLNDLLGNIIEDAEENGYADDEEIDEEASREVDDAINRLGDLVSQLGALFGTDGDDEE